MASKFVPFSDKQLRIFEWWRPWTPYRNYKGIIADGAIRAGKTVPMAISFVIWAMTNFDGQEFAMCGFTVTSFKFNVWNWLHNFLTNHGFAVSYHKTENRAVVSSGTKTNTFFIFGGGNEGSQDLIQGKTLAGVLFDEVALLAESFVNQATGRCSVEGSKFWFNCNPEGPSHWFKKNWLDCAKIKRLYHLHFLMQDNPSLSAQILADYDLMYRSSPAFYNRFILGQWSVAEGVIYTSFTDDLIFDDTDLQPNFWTRDYVHRYIAIDFGVVNPTCFLDLWYDKKNRMVYVMDEYYHGSKDVLNQKSTAQYKTDLEAFIARRDRSPYSIFIDPSAAPLKVELRGMPIKDAVNDVHPGIVKCYNLFAQKRIRVHRRCAEGLRELRSYAWDAKKSDNGEEKPLKVNDHWPDSLRYFVNTALMDRDLKVMSASVGEIK